MALLISVSHANAQPVGPSASSQTERAAAASVLRIFSFANPNGQPPSKILTETLPNLPLGNVSFPLPVNLRSAFQAEACRLNKLTWCPIFREETRGTAFSVERPGRFMTCRHLVQDWIYWAALYNDILDDISAIIPPIAMADAQGRLLFVSISPGGGGYKPTLFAVDVNLEAPLHRLLKGDLFWEADFLQFDIADHLGIAPLPRKKNILVGETVSLIGFPDLGSNEALGRARISNGIMGSLRSGAWTTSAASAKGMSGGPLIDNEGQVGAMSCSLRRDRKASGGRAIATSIDPETIADRLLRTHDVEVIRRP